MMTEEVFYFLINIIDDKILSQKYKLFKRIKNFNYLGQFLKKFANGTTVLERITNHVLMVLEL